MKALSLWQPWASAMAVGSKMVETRSWATSYRGWVAIHAAKRIVEDEMERYVANWTWCGALSAIGWVMGESHWRDLPTGAVVAVGRLEACRPTGSFTVDELSTVRFPDRPSKELYGWTEGHLGDFSAGRWGWVFGVIFPLTRPLPLRGRQGLWDLGADEVAAIKARMPSERQAGPG